jgi:hypothetical protein
MEKKYGTGRAALTVLDAAFTVVVLMLSLKVLKLFLNEFDVTDMHYAADWVSAAGLFIAQAASELVRGLTQRGGTKLNRFRHLLGAGLLLAGGVLTILRQGDYFSARFSGLSFALILLLGRIDSIRRDRRARNIIMNVLAMLLILLLLGTLMSMIFTPLFLMFLSLLHVAVLAFSQINFRALQKVLRKTYAVEIFCGMLLLIVAFSVLLCSEEEGMETFGDALWYCFAIVTTIGFGDITATSALGRVLSVILGAYGIIVVSLITSVIVNFYNEVKDAPEPAQDIGDKEENP